MEILRRPPRLRVVLVKPSKYGLDGTVERFRRGFMPNATLPHMASMTPPEVTGHQVNVHVIDEYVECHLDYLRLLEFDPDCKTLLALVGVQTHQFHRALDLAAYARAHGVSHVVIGGPHPMTLDTTMMQGRGVSFALAEAELIRRRFSPTRWLADCSRSTVTRTRRGRKCSIRQCSSRRRGASCTAMSSRCSASIRRAAARIAATSARVIKIAGRQIRSQPVGDDDGDSARGQGGGRGADHVHHGQLQQVRRGGDAAASHHR